MPPPTPEQLTQALPTTIDELETQLHTHNIKGVKTVPGCCPIAKLLQLKLNWPFIHLNNCHIISITPNRADQTAPIPELHRTWLSGFDRGDRPEFDAGQTHLQILEDAVNQFDPKEAIKLNLQGDLWSTTNPLTAWLNAKTGLLTWITRQRPWQQFALQRHHGGMPICKLDEGQTHDSKWIVGMNLILTAPLPPAGAQFINELINDQWHELTHAYVVSEVSQVDWRLNCVGRSVFHVGKAR